MSAAVYARPRRGTGMNSATIQEVKEECQHLTS